MMFVMKKWLAWIGICAALTAPAYAAEALEEAPPENSDRRVLRTLEVNRNMLARFEAEYALLRQVEADTPPIVKTEMRKLRYKMKALNEDTARLRAQLSMDEQAKIFLDEAIVTARRKAAEIELNDPIRRLHEEGLRLVAEKRMAEAAQVYEEITLKSPDDDQAYIILGHVYLLSGEYEKSERAFHNAVSIDGENIGQIVPFYENLIMQSAEDDQAQSNLGYACLMVGDYGRARQAFMDALSIDGDNESALKGLILLDSA